MSHGSKTFSTVHSKVDLITGDLHLNDNPRDAYRHDFMATGLPHLLRRSKPDRLVVLGDLTDEKDRHSAWLVNKTVDHFHNLLEHVRQIIVLRGNHDYLDEANPFFQFLERIDGLHFISEPRLIGGKLFLPHTINPARDWKGLDRAELAYAHNTFAGAVAQNGDKLLDGIALEDIPAKRVISGDVHVPQVCGKVTYVGAPYRIDFGDDFEPRILLANGASASLETGKLVRQKRLIDLSDVTAREAGKARPGDIVKIRVHLKYKDIAEWSAAREQIAAWANEREFQVHSIIPLVYYQPGIRLVVAERKTDRKLVFEYASAKGLDKATRETGIELL